MAVAVEKIANTFKLFAKYSTELGTAFKILISLKIGFMLIRWGRALIPIVASMRALVSLSGVGLGLVAASVLASALAYKELGEALDSLEKKINKNFQAQKKAYDPTMLLDQLASHKKVTKELEKQEKVIFNIFESNNKLVAVVKKAEILDAKFKKAFDANRITRSHDAMHKMMNETIGQSETFRDYYGEEINK